MFKKSIFALLVSVATFTSAYAAPLCMTSGTYADLLATNAGGGCMVADKVFSDFTYATAVSGGADPVASTEFAYATVADEPFAVGFIFNFSLNAFAGQSNDILVGYLVSGPNITSNHATLVGGALGNAFATLAETFCKGSAIATCDPSQSETFIVNSANPTQRSFFSPVNQLGILKDINVAAASGGANFATISGIVNTVDQNPIPEPTSMILFGTGLAAVLVARRRFKA